MLVCYTDTVSTLDDVRLSTIYIYIYIYKNLGLLSYKFMSNGSQQVLVARKSLLLPHPWANNSKKS